MKRKYEQMPNDYYGDDYYDEDDTNYVNGANFFFLYCLHILTVNVFHVQTGNQIIYRKRVKIKLGYDVVV